MSDLPTLRQGFENEVSQKIVVDTRRTALTATLFFPAFLPLDYAVFPALFGLFLAIRAVVVLLSLAVFLLMGVELGRRHARGFALFMYFLCGLSITLMVHLSGGYTSLYYAGINLVLVALLFLLPLDPVRTGVVCLVLYGGYLGPILLLQRITEPPLFLNNNLFLLATIVVVVLSSHLSTQIRYREYSGRTSLAQANEELRRMDDLKSQFFANVSHEVRTPLTSILAPIQTLHAGDAGTLDPLQSALVAQMYRNALKLLDMINQMLDFARFEARKMQLRLRPVDIGELARDTVAIFREVTERKGVRLHFSQAPEIPTAYLDPEKVERILTNLIRNAIKFTDRGSIAVRVSGRTDGLLLEVRDTGIGIPSAHLPEIFKRFQQVDGSSTRRYEGTGLGLTIVREAVELMRGRVTVESEEGRGSAFRVEIPIGLESMVPDAFLERRQDDRRKVTDEYGGRDRRTRSRRSADSHLTVDELALVERELAVSGSPPEEGELPAPSPAEGDTVLLVEDNADLRAMVGRMLGRFGYRVTTAVDGMDGWEHARHDPPDIVVSDVMMPRLDGFELTRRIKTNPGTKHVPVILITAKSELESRLAGLELGADDYLAKPLHLRELEARIRNLLTARRFQLALARESELKTRMEELCMSFSQSLELRDSGTAGHSRDVLELGTLIGEELGVAGDEILRDALLLHDIGKLGIPDSILLKPTALNAEERSVMNTHPQLGARILDHFPTYRAVSEIVRAHQEHWDGTGYPSGLRGEDIPLYARIVAVADAYHAMTSDRPYRSALAPARAADELRRGAGTQFDPGIVPAFLRALERRGRLGGS